ncbi:phosphomannomutase/phosphoglucomutase [Patescibacteria group bacterium]|nr:phosphomannomutase/phosphoglucomutase [Patescibacteria group bacterium]
MLLPGIFKTNDIRGVWGEDWDEKGAERVVEAMAAIFKPKKVVVGRDLRPSSPKIFEVLSQKFTSLGVEVWDLGEITTDISYFIAGKWQQDLNIMITASHHPLKYNGLKCTLPGGTIVFDLEQGQKIKDFVFSKKEISVFNGSKELKKDPIPEYKEAIFSLVDKNEIKPLKIVVDAGNGVVGRVLPEIVKELPLEIVKMNFEPEDDFVDHLADPLIQGTLKELEEEVIKRKADFGASFDHDGDRIAIVDDQGRIISGSAMTAVFAEHFLARNPGGSVGFNAICGRVVPKAIKGAGGTPVRIKVGHALIKQAMREKKLIFAGEHSYHFYFPDLFNADSGIAALLVFAQIISRSAKTASETCFLHDIYPQSGEFSFKVRDKDRVVKVVGQEFVKEAKSVDYLDGISVWFEDWWFNLRSSGTEQLVRLNIEADNEQVLKEKQALLTGFIADHQRNGYGG